jgi:hypothetical protein
MKRKIKEKIWRKEKQCEKMKIEKTNFWNLKRPVDDSLTGTFWISEEGWATQNYEGKKWWFFTVCLVHCSWIGEVLIARGNSPGQKWWPTLLGTEISCTQWEGPRCLAFFSFSGKRGEGGSHLVPQVPNVFPNIFSIAPFSSLVRSQLFLFKKREPNWLVHQQVLWNIGHAPNRSTSLEPPCKIETNVLP